MVINHIKQSENLTALSTIPVYLWVICNLLHKDNELKDEIKSFTSLNDLSMHLLDFYTKTLKFLRSLHRIENL